MITLVTRAGCHLCEQAAPVVHQVARECGARVEVLDLDEDQRSPAPRCPPGYSELVPVVLVDGREHDHWRVDAGRLTAAVRARGSGATRRQRWWRTRRR
ncbi:MAG: glutaredoxin family protein [Actinomycetales bacterium]